MPDADAILRQIDLLEKGGDAFPDVLFLQSVLRSVRSISSEVYNRVRELLISPPMGLRTAIFSNENRRETYLERTLAGEPEEKYDLRLLTHAVQWLNKHWDGMASAVLLSDAAKNRYGDDVPISFVKSIVADNVKLGELYADHDDTDAMDVDVTQQNRFIFSDYLPERKARAGVKSGRYYQGTYRPSMYNVREAWISVAMDPKDKSNLTKVLLAGRENQNRAIDGDSVIIELLPKTEWRSASNLAVMQDDLHDESEDEDDDPADKLAKDGGSKSEPVPCGKVVAIAKRNWRPYCGTISGESHRGGESALFVPIDRNVPKIRIRSKRVKELLGKRLIVVIDKWDRSSAHPAGHIVREVGASGDKEAETEVILIENGIPTRKFSKAAMACLPGEDWEVTEEHIKTRWDLRDTVVCSVDPPGCTDIDDALHFKRISDNEVEIGVHIADVTAFVAHDSALDKEAAERGCTVYLVDRRIEMLPSLLSGNFCSLRGGEERLAFSAIVRMDNDGNIIDSRFGRSVIKSKAAMTYQVAQERIDAARKVLGKDESSIDDVTRGLLGLASIARKLRERRMKAGALILASPEVKFKISELTDEITDVSMYETRETNRMVEEFMLLANVVVAEKTLKQFPQCAVLRRHPRPSEEMFEPLLKAAKAAGYEIDVSNSKNLNESLAKLDADAKKKGDEYLGTLMRIIATRSMTQAVYFSSGEVSDPEFLHYGLASPVYTHFTSPIRRYADVLVHRLLSACLGFSSLPMSLQNSKRMNQMCEVINLRHRCAQFASRASTVLHTVLLFRNKTLREPARILRIMGNGLVVLVPKYGVEGVVHIDEAVVDEAGQSMKLPNGKEYKVLGEVNVQISVDSKPERPDKVVYTIV